MFDLKNTKSDIIGPGYLGPPLAGQYDAVIVAVAHSQFRETGAAGIEACCKPDGVLYDVKYLLSATEVAGRL